MALRRLGLISVSTPAAKGGAAAEPRSGGHAERKSDN